MKNWDDLKLLLALSRYRTMTASAKSLGVSTATVSRRIDRLTEEIGATLFVRRGAELEPTTKARQLIELAEQLDADFSGAIVGDDDKLSKARKLRLSICFETLMSLAKPYLAEFLAEHPELQLELYHEKRSVAFGEVDLLVGFNEPTEGRLVRSQIGTLSVDTYFHKNWTDGPKQYVTTTASQKDAIKAPFEAVLEGLFGPPRLRTSGLLFGIGLLESMPFAICLPSKLAENYPELIPFQHGAPKNQYAVWVSYHENRRLDPDVRSGLEFLRKCFSH